MSLVVRRWLRERLIKLVQVQRCVFGIQGAMAADPVRTPELVVQTWAGILIYIHLIDEPMKPARIKRILEQATGAGISTVFIVDAQILPHQGERVNNDRWFMALQAVANDQIYTYTENGPTIRPVHFAPVSRHEVQTHYGQPVEIEHLRHYRSTARLNVIKGYWLVGDFEPDMPTRSQPFRRPESQPRPAAGSYEQPAAENERAAPSKPTHLDICLQLLGVAAETPRDEVKAAFRRLAFEVHPDVSSLPKEEAEARFKALSEAYEYIKATRGWQ